MTAFDGHIDLALSNVAVAPSPTTSGTTLTVSGATWPTPPFAVVIHAAGANESTIAAGAEIARCTAYNTGTKVMTLTRNVAGPNGARSVQVGDTIKAPYVAGHLQNIEGRFTGAVTLQNTAASASTTSGTFKMQGLGSGWAITPGASGVVSVVITCLLSVPGGGTGVYAKAAFGTGTAPSDEGADAGATIGSSLTGSGGGGFVVAASGTPVTFAGVLALTAGTAYWFDLSLATNGSTVTATVPTISVMERP